MALIDELKKDSISLRVGNIMISEEMNNDLKYLKGNGIALTDIIILALKKLPVSRLVKEMKEAEKAKQKSTDNALTDAPINTSNDAQDDAQKNTSIDAPMNTSNNELDDALTMKQKL